MEEIEDTAEFVTQTLPVKCFPVLHGGSYVSLGFNFGRPGELVYISDVKIIPPESMEYLKSLPQIRVLVIDCLNPAGREHYAHFNLTEALECIAVLNPVKAYLVGMCCKCGDHDAMNEAIRAMGLDNVELAYDGMRLNGLHKA
jgi:phosphoribosyl 1,2-cyclic phosphodiesterase